MALNAAEGFRRIAKCYNAGWWCAAFLVVPIVLLYVYLSGPRPLDVEPDLWFWLRPCLLTAISLVLLATATWIVSGFLAPKQRADGRYKV